MAALNSIEQFDSPSAPKNRRLLIAVGGMALLHGFAFYFVEYQRTELPVPVTSIVVDLLQLQQSEEEVIEPVIKPDQPLPDEDRESQISIAPEPSVAPIQSEPTQSLYERAIVSVRKQFDAQPAEGLEGKQFKRPITMTEARIPVARRIEVTDPHLGYAMIKTVDRKGNVTCVQERGDWSNWGHNFKSLDKMNNPNLFYLVKDEMCGHIK